MNKHLMLNEPIQIFAHSFGWIKTLGITLISMASGWLAGKTVALFQVLPSAAWYENPAVVAAAVAAVVGIVLKIFERRWHTADKKRDREEQQVESHRTYSERLQELTSRERDQLLGGLKEFHQREIEFWRARDKLRTLETFEARARAHRFGNEVNRLNAHIFILHNKMSVAGVEIPEFQLKNYDDLMEGVSHEIEIFKKTLVEQLEEITGPTG